MALVETATDYNQAYGPMTGQPVSIHIQIDSLRAAISRLENAVNELPDRLSAVSRTATPGLNSVGPEPIANSPIAHELANFASIVDRLFAQIDSIKTNLDI